MMIPNYECIVTGAGTSADGELRIWQNVNKNETGHFLFHDGNAKGVYTIAISPSGKYLAAGSKVGLVRVWPFLNHSMSEGSSFLFEIYHYLGPVTALAFLTDDLLLSAGVNGKIRIISISKGKQIRDVDAHSGGICSLVAMGSKVVSSLGHDGILKIWDIDSLSCEFQMEGFIFPRDPFSIFPMLSFSQETGYLCAPSTDGTLHLLNLRNNCSHETIKAHQNAFYATASCGEYLATGGMHDKKLKFWDLRKKSLSAELESNASFLRLCSIGKEKVAAICLDPDKTQSLRLFLLPDLRPLGTIVNLNLRSMATLPLPAVEDFKRSEIIHEKKELIKKARLKIMSPQQMGPFLKQLVEKGFWAEAKLLQAESAKLLNKPLYELEFLLQLTKVIKLSQATAQIYYRLAELFERLNEPILAFQHYEKIKPLLAGIEASIERVKSHPLLHLNPDKTVRTDISLERLTVQEMEKDAVLGRYFRWHVIIPIRESSNFKIKTLYNIDLWEEHIRSQTVSFGRDVKMAQEDVVLFDGQRKREFRWLRISEFGIHCPSLYLDYAIEIVSENGQVHGYLVFNPNKITNGADDISTHNALLAKAYGSVCQERTTENWFRSVHEAIKGLDIHASFKSA